MKMVHKFGLYAFLFGLGNFQKKSLLEKKLKVTKKAKRKMKKGGLTQFSNVS